MGSKKGVYAFAEVFSDIFKQRSKPITKAAIYIRFSSDQGLDAIQQRDALIAKFGNTHEIIGEYRDGSSQEVEDCLKNKKENHHVD